jgi:hypothetical protein
VSQDAQQQRLAELEQRNAELEQRNAELFEGLSALRIEVARLSAVHAELRKENARLVEENRALRKRLGGKGGGGTSGGSDGESTAASLREKAEKQRQGKARRKAARAAAEPAPRGRGKRSKRPAFEADETMVIDVPVEELPADAKPNGYVERAFYGARLGRHNVRVRLREYISPTAGRIVAKRPPIGPLGLSAEKSYFADRVLCHLTGHGGRLSGLSAGGRLTYPYAAYILSAIRPATANHPGAA